MAVKEIFNLIMLHEKGVDQEIMCAQYLGAVDRVGKVLEKRRN